MKITDCPCECHKRGEWFCDNCDTIEKVVKLKNIKIKKNN